MCWFSSGNWFQPPPQFCTIGWGWQKAHSKRLITPWLHSLIGPGGVTIDSLSPICSPSCTICVRLKKNKQLNLDVKIYFCLVTS
jgi:hypothetical protein